MYARTDSPKYLCRKCNRKIEIATLESVFHDELKSFFADSTKLAGQIVQAEQNLKQREALIAVNQQAIQKIREEMKQTHRLYVEGHITPQGFGEFYKPAEERLNQLVAELPKLQAEVDLLKVNRLWKPDSASRRLEDRDLPFATRHSLWTWAPPAPTDLATRVAALETQVAAQQTTITTQAGQISP